MNKWVKEAVRVAMLSPCLSQRGVVIWKDDERISGGFNHQPLPFVCDKSDRCKKTCGKTAIHAEQSAILAAAWTSRFDGASMLHVKVRGGRPCASIAPSCLECSKLILATGISWMHLLHDSGSQILPGAQVIGEVDGFLSDGQIGTLQIRSYSAVQFHWLTATAFHKIELVEL